LLTVEGLTKRFPGVIALENVSLSLGAAEVIAIIGENGAGKSTLMKILSGVYQPDEGFIELEGTRFQPKSPSEALDAGIRIIYQELSGLDNLDIASNIFLGREKRIGGFVDSKSMQAESRTILSRIGLDRDPRTLLGDLPIAEKQLVEIARALSLKVKVLILDEPTSSLTSEETETLLGLVKELKSQGVSIIYITHRLDEINQIADRIVALRDGKNAGELNGKTATKQEMIKMMIGRDLERATHSVMEQGPVVLEADGLVTGRYPAIPNSFKVHQGEILGVAGLVGAGRSEIARALFGIDRFSGSVMIDGKPARLKRPQDAIRHGVFLIPEDRRGCGLTVELSVAENATLPQLKSVSKGGLVNAAKQAQRAQNIVDRMKVKTAALNTTISTLSGGNQQKVVLGRWLELGPKLLIVDEPTRGIDVGSKSEIYDQLRAIADAGTAILMISSDMEEIINISDRVMVMHEGRITGTVAGADIKEETIMKLATGGN
jgi:ribose transport system ATP-binding protein